jgi:hypothetical protein
MVLVSKPAMLQEALAVCTFLEKVCPGSSTLVLAGELLEKSENFALPEATNLVKDSLRPAILAGNYFAYRIARFGALRVLWTSLAISRRRRNAKSLIAAFKPAVLIVFEDRVIDPEMAWLDAAAQCGLPAVMVRYATSSVESDVWTRSGKTSYSLEQGAMAWARRLFSNRHSRHAIAVGQHRYLFFSLWDSIALHLFGMADTHPWIAGGGKVRASALQGKMDYDEAVEYSNLPNRFHVTGQPTWDAMATTCERLREERSLSAATENSPCVLVCALPQWGEHLQMSWPAHMASIEQLFAILGALECKVIISLHPKACREHYHALAERHRCAISPLQLSELLPGADIFVASWSSTLRWSAMLGITSINLDWANQQYTVFSKLPTLLQSKIPADLEATLVPLTQDKALRENLGNRLQKESEEFGVMNGKAGQAILSLAKSFIREKTS